MTTRLALHRLLYIHRVAVLCMCMALLFLFFIQIKPAKRALTRRLLVKVDVRPTQ